MLEQFGPDLLLLERLAFGGMAEVFLAKSVGVGGFEKTVAVKRILPHFSASHHFQAMFEREMKICAELQHPNIIQVYRNGACNGYLYLVMEYIAGKSVLDLLARVENDKKLLPIPLACFIARETARGLAYAHNYSDRLTGEHIGIVHRDISPHNLMLTYTGEVKILDFGIARAADSSDLTKTGEIKGKIPYMAPEVIGGNLPTSQADLFSLGVVLFELLAVHPLFDGESTFQTMKQVQECKIPSLRSLNADVPIELERIVNTILARDLDKRYQSAEEVERDLTIFLNKHHPEFSSHTVSDILGKLFEAEIVEQRKSRKILLSGAISQEQRTSMINDIDTGVTTIAQSPRTQLSMLTIVLLLSIMITIIIGLSLHGGRAQQPGLVQKLNTAAPIDPVTISGNLALFSADQIKSSDGTPVQSWAAGNGIFALQSDPNLSPKLKKNKLAGHATVAFDGNNDFLTADDLARQLKFCSQRSFIYVAATSKDKVQYVIAAHQIDYNLDVLRAGFAVGKKLRLKQNPDHFYADSPGPFATDEFAVYTAFFDENGAQLYRNSRLAVESHEHGVSTSVIDNFSIGQEWDGHNPSDFFEGQLAELVVFCRQLSEPERLGIEQHLSRFYGIPLE